MDARRHLQPAGSASRHPAAWREHHQREKENSIDSIDVYSSSMILRYGISYRSQCRRNTSFFLIRSAYSSNADLTASAYISGCCFRIDSPCWIVRVNPSRKVRRISSSVISVEMAWLSIFTPAVTTTCEYNTEVHAKLRETVSVLLLTIKSGVPGVRSSLTAPICRLQR